MNSARFRGRPEIASSSIRNGPRHARTLLAATRELQRLNRALRRGAFAAAPERGEAAEIGMILAARRLALARLGAGMSDIAWTLLLEAYAARLEGRSIAITRIGAAGGVSRSTAHRWARWLVARGLLAAQPGAGRATMVTLGDQAAKQVRACLAEARGFSAP